MNKISQEQILKIIKLYKQGVSSPKISAKLDVSCTTVLRILKKNNIEIRKNKNPEAGVKNRFKRKLNKNQELNLIKIYKKGTSTENLSQMFNISPYNIHKILKKNSLEKEELGYQSKKLSKEQQSEVLNLYSQGLFATQIAKQLKVSAKTIKTILKNNNVRIIPAGEKLKIFTPEQEQEIIGLYQRGNSMKGISKLYKVSRTPIRKILIENNIEIRLEKNFTPYIPPHKINKKNNFKVMELYQQGSTIGKIAKQFDVDYKTIERLLKKNNILSEKGNLFQK